MLLTVEAESGYGYDAEGRLYVCVDGRWVLGHSAQSRNDRAFQEYVWRMGHEPPLLAPDDPLAWQWDTRLTVKERRRRLGVA